MNPLPPLRIRDLEREVQDRASHLKPLQTLVVVKSFKKGKCYGIGYNREDLILKNFGVVVNGLFRPCPAVSGLHSVNVVDIGGATRTLGIYGTTAGNMFNYYDGGSVLSFGNPASPPTPARTDYEIASKVAEIVPSSTTLDETLWRIKVTGSYVWSAGGTVRDAGQYARWTDNLGSLRTFLLYYDAVSDVVVPSEGTLSVTYTTQI